MNFLGQEVKKSISDEAMVAALAMQQNEITEYATYKAIAAGLKDGKNKKVLEKIGDEEKIHYEIWKGYTGQQMKPQAFKVLWRKLLAFLLGFTFTIKLMENNEAVAQKNYAALAKEVPECKKDSGAGK